MLRAPGGVACLAVFAWHHTHSLRARTTVGPRQGNGSVALLLLHCSHEAARPHTPVALSRDDLSFACFGGSDLSVFTNSDLAGHYIVTGVPRDRRRRRGVTERVRVGVN